MYGIHAGDYNPYRISDITQTNGLNIRLTEHFINIMINSNPEG